MSAAFIFAASLNIFAHENGGKVTFKSLIIKEDASTLTCRDADGKEVALHKNPKRVIVNYISLVGLWYSAGGTAVGIPESIGHENIPKDAKSLPRTGSFQSPNMERILVLKPDLVIFTANVNTQRTAKEFLDGKGVETLLLRYENYTDFLGLLELFCHLNGTDMNEDSKAGKIASAVDAIIQKTTAFKGPRFVCLMGSGKGVSAETSNSHTSHMIILLGGRNIITEAGQSSTHINFSMERLIMEKPDIIFFTTMGDSKKIIEKLKETLMADETWKRLRAVREGKVFFLPNELFLYRPNDRFPEAFEYLAKIMYPEIKPEKE